MRPALPVQAEEAKRREEEQARLEARRAAIRDRIARQHEVAARMAEERARAEEAARGAIGRFMAAKPLHLKLQVGMRCMGCGVAWI